MSEDLTYTQLAELANIAMGQSPGSERYNKEEYGLPFLQGCAEFGPRNPEPEIYCHPPLRIAKQGSILISVRAPVGTMNMADQDYCIGRGLGAIQGMPGVAVTPFLRYAIIQNAGFLHRRSQGSTFLAIGSDDLKRLPIPKLDINIQERIAEILEAVDETIEKTESLIAKYQKIKAGLMHDLFTRGVTAHGKLRPPREQAPELYKETPIGWIPKEWECRKLGAILLESGGYLQTGPFGSQLHAHEYTHEGVPVVMPQDIEDGMVLVGEIARIQESRAQLLARHRLMLGDIVIARRGELSRAAAISYNELGWVCGTGCFLLRLSGSNLSSQFFSYVYRHDVIQRQIDGMSVGTTMPSLNNAVMNALYFPYVKEDEQTRITERLEMVDRKLRTLNTEKVKLEKQRAGLMRDLLTGRVRVHETLHVAANI